MEWNFSRTTQKFFYGFDTITFNHNLLYRFLYFSPENKLQSFITIFVKRVTIKETLKYKFAD